MEAYTKYQVRRGKKITDDFKKALEDSTQVHKYGIEITKMATRKILGDSDHYDYHLKVLRLMLTKVDLFDNIANVKSIIHDEFLSGPKKSYATEKKNDQNGILEDIFKNCRNQCDKLDPASLLPGKITSTIAIKALVNHQQKVHNSQSFVDQIFDHGPTLEAMSNGILEPLCKYLLRDWNAGKNLAKFIKLPK